MAANLETPTFASSDSEHGDKKSIQDGKVHESIDNPEGLANLPGHIAGSSPFSDPKVAAYYVSVYEKSRYEARHVFDPDLEWTKQEERKLVRKLDWHVCVWAVSFSTFKGTAFTDYLI